MDQKEVEEQFKNWLQKQHHYSIATKRNYLQGLKRVDISNLHESLERLKRNAATKTYNLTITSLKHVSNVVGEPLRSELKSLKKLKHENVNHHKPYSLEQMKQILDTAIGWKKHCIEIAFYAGLRKSEIQRLNFHDIDLKMKRIRVLGKGGKVRYVPLNSITFLEKWKKIRDLKKKSLDIGENWLFTSTGRRPNLQSGGVFAALSKKIGFAVKLHSCRKSYALAMYKASNHDLRLVQLLLGHADINTTQIYLNLTENDVLNRVNQIRRLYE